MTASNLTMPKVPGIGRPSLPRLTVPFAGHVLRASGH
jgi:hypothetical protein